MCCNRIVVSPIESLIKFTDYKYFIHMSYCWKTSKFSWKILEIHSVLHSKFLSYFSNQIQFFNHWCFSLYLNPKKDFENFGKIDYWFETS